MNEKSVRHSIEHGAVRVAMALAGRLPVRVAHGVGAVLGTVAFDLLRLRRDVSMDNVMRALSLPERDATPIARRAYQNLGRSLMEFAAFPQLTRAEVRDRVTFEGLEHFDAVLRAGKGAVFVTGHHGNWEMLGAAMAANGLPIDFLVGEQRNARVDAVMNDLRSSHGIGIITRAMSLRKMMQALADNRVICMLADQDARRHGAMVEFLGRPASTVRGPAVFSIRRGSPIVTGFIHREGSRHRAIIQPPIYPPDLPEDEAVRALTQAHADRLAAHIRRYPDEYFWPHRRWKTKSAQ